MDLDPLRGLCEVTTSKVAMSKGGAGQRQTLSDLRRFIPDCRDVPSSPQGSWIPGAKPGPSQEILEEK